MGSSSPNKIIHSLRDASALLGDALSKRSLSLQIIHPSEFGTPIISPSENGIRFDGI